MYEHRHEPLLAYPVFLRRVLRSAYIAAVIVITALGAGVLGYHFLEDIPWVDAILDASMILGGMGPVSQLQTVAGKLFASAYALFSGLVFIAATGILMAPFVHRFLHHFHLESR
ncbi:MAG: hypothetical protein HY083_01395 [Gammaproteobacteria bacterium]|nr:hypothetical protein [Gammaproteobacteria bacterium]